LVVKLLCDSGLRLMNALRLRIKDVDFQMRQLTVRDGKGAKRMGIVKRVSSHAFLCQFVTILLSRCAATGGFGTD
jgi:integrase